MKTKREWAMPNANTFKIDPIRRFIGRYNQIDIRSVDPFANSNKIAAITNDLNPEMNTDYNMDALEFLKSLEDKSVDLMLFDPPYSPRQVSEVYKQFDMTVNMETTQSSFWSKLKDEISRVVAPNGVVLSFGWNSQGMGINRGFNMVEILLVAHGGNHNDTICVSEKKRPELFDV